METDQRIRCIRKHNNVSNENTVLSTFWEQIPGTRPVEVTTKPIEEIINLVNKAKKTIYLYSPKITSSELRNHLLLRSKEDRVKIYILTSGLDTHAKNKMFTGIEIAREKPDISSTCVVIDPKTDSAEGIWFPGELTKNQKDLPFILHLTKDQAREMWAHFSYWFWRAEGNEVAKEKVRPVKPFLPSPPEVRSNLAHVFRMENLEEIFGRIPASKLWLTEKRPVDMEPFCIDVKEVVVPLNVSSQPLIDASKETAEYLFGSEDFPFNYSIIARKKILFASDLGFVLDRDQANGFETIYGDWTWKFRDEGGMGDIHQTIRLITPEGISESVEVCENQTVELETVSCKTFDEWIQGGITPEIPQNIVFSRLITYQWNMCPPLLPGDAKKHVLYTQWNNFTNEVKEYTGSLLRNLKKAEESMGELQKVIQSKKFSEWRKSLEKFSETKWESQTKESVESLLDQLSNISTAIQEKITEIQKPPEEPVDEFTASGKGKTGHSHKQEIVYPIGDIKKIREKIPRLPLPSTGTLYAWGPRVFLAITDIHQINPGKLIAKEFPAELVAKPEERND